MCNLTEEETPSPIPVSLSFFFFEFLSFEVNILLEIFRTPSQIYVIGNNCF